MRTSHYSALALLPFGMLCASGCNQDKGADSAPGVVDRGNTAPTANAGSDQTQPADLTITLNGSGSIDADGDALTYGWTFDHVPPGSAIQDREAPFSRNHTTTADTTTFQPDKVGTYVVSLVVTDPSGATSSPDYVIVTAADPESIPVANAGADQSVPVGSSAALSGTGSYDPVGRALTYVWTIVGKPTNSTVTAVTDPTAVSPTLGVDAKGTYILSLVVNNGLASSNADEMSVTGTADDSPPTANAGPDQMAAQDCTTLTLNCLGSSDPDGDPLSYFWSLQSNPAGSNTDNTTLSDQGAANPTFYPDIAGSYVFSCAVKDGTNWSVPDTVTVVAAERTVNTRPVVNAGVDHAVDAGSATCEPSGYVYDCDECSDKVVALGSDASVSDPDGDPISLVWTLESGVATIADATSLTTSVTLEKIEPSEPGACEDTSVTFKLSVTDCTGAVSTDTVKFTATCCGTEDTSSR
ncbi:MAG: PKD domain-containing protein [Myxococcales bacterium]|nr:PKD domain-containing protein [Myxococcales bacterium]